MFDRIAVAAVSVVLVIGAVTFGASLITGPDSAAGPCPATVNEADAVDTFAPGLSQAQRAWGIAAGAPGSVRPGFIAGFATDPPNNNPGTVVLLDPATGTRCFLIRLASNHPIQDVTYLDWSPSGDALAIGLAGQEGPDGQEDGVVLVYTRDRIYRIWSGEGSPGLAWAPDGRGIVVWSFDGVPATPDTRLIFADGAPDRTYTLAPYGRAPGLLWSPDGGQWIVAEATEQGGTLPDTAVSIVNVGDGRITPLEIGTGHVRPIGWTDHESVIVETIVRQQGVTGYLDVPIADPSSFRVLAGPEESLSYYAFLSPDRRRLLYVAGTDASQDTGDLSVIDVTPGADRSPVRLTPGTKSGPAEFAWSPDGGQVMFQVVDVGLWIANADGSGLRQVASSGIVVVDDPWQPVPVR